MLKNGELETYKQDQSHSKSQCKWGIVSNISTVYVYVSIYLCSGPKNPVALRPPASHGLLVDATGASSPV